MLENLNEVKHRSILASTALTAAGRVPSNVCYVMCVHSCASHMLSLNRFWCASMLVKLEHLLYRTDIRATCWYLWRDWLLFGYYYSWEISQMNDQSDYVWMYIVCNLWNEKPEKKIIIIITEKEYFARINTFLY